MDRSKKVVVLGGGSFGTVLANLAASNGYQVSLWVRDSEHALELILKALIPRITLN